jgi:hypothetical protein
MIRPHTRFAALVSSLAVVPLLVGLLAGLGPSVGAQEWPTEGEATPAAAPAAQTGSREAAPACRTTAPAPDAASVAAAPSAQGRGSEGAVVCAQDPSLPLAEDAAETGVRSVPRGTELSPEDLQRIKSGQAGVTPPVVQPQQEDPSE